ncbi:hypothetical protein B0H66DRAFT_331519 [Apodospora peruviana]|uniref:Gem-associated protein 5 TPR domain-containing protein n=1 Tax=Apodospora peruviana TaxID=516989 RepID=A0AAE0M167_9PEZI|nr:hypothetical protein B0H66DRAFT_331519 [Apodospora peruviana]
MSAAGQLTRGRAGSSNSALEASSMGRTAHMQDFAMAPASNVVPRYIEPCAATASMFLYAQGNSVVCAHHDSLTIERRFARHSEEVQLLAVDNASEMGAGRLVVSYDAGQTAIVWDLLTGDEVARFASYENLTCASWMRNGNVAFGNIQGNVIMFEPSTSEHISARTIDQISITAIAPASDCRTFAIGYQNGSLLIATLQPRFTILHNLSTSRGPSPIVTLAWHASSSRQKSDMLAVQTNDGDLRVWSVSKSYNSEDPAKVVRILKRTENYLSGPNWMGWSKNGRIIQYSESETISWDVRTKHVTYDTIPTLDNIRGLAVYGPGASLFTLGANNTVQQFDLNAPAMMVANVQHPANLLPPSPPISLEAEDKSQNANLSESESSVSIAIHAELSEPEDLGMSPLARLVQGEDSDIEKYRTTSPVSSRSRSSVSISSSSSQTPARGYTPSIVSRQTENTYISAGSSLRSSVAPYRERRERESFSTTSSVSMTSSNYRARHRPSRLRHEVPRSPEESKVLDLFKFTKSRLIDMPFRTPFATDNSRMTNDDLRRQMLLTIFGWNKEIDDLIRDEMARHPLGSTSRILLAKWLGDISTDVMTMGSENMTSSDWMLLALSGIGGQASQHKLGRAYVQRLLENGDVHAAATIMIGLGDHNDAIEIYVSHKKYMEALILTCLFFPATWERQEQIVRRWGEWAVQHGQQQLAIRCFACTGHESTEAWTSPSAQQLSFPSITQTVPELLSPPMSPPSQNHGPQRSIAKTSALKLITSFGGESQAKAKFFQGGFDDGKTPIAAGATPIQDSALSPGGHGDPATAVLRSNRSQFATPASARPPNAFNRGRLPSIGEAPDANHRELRTAVNRPPGDPYAMIKPIEVNNHINSLDLPRASTASPRMKGGRAQPPPSPSPAAVAALMESSRKRNGSRTRIPEGLDLSLPQFNDSLPDDLISPDQSTASSAARYHWPSRRRGPGSVASSVTSAASSVRHHRGHNQGKSLDDYIHSLDSASTTGHGRASSRDGRSRVRESSRSRRTDREDSEDRGRGGSSRAYTPKGGKRSPKSPVPMSPEDLINLATPKDEAEFAQEVHSRGQLIDISPDEMEQPPTVRKVSAHRDTSRLRDTSRARESSRVRESSRARDTSRLRASSRGASRSGRAESRDGRRARSPDRRVPPALELRGRSSRREGSSNRSPSSPLPMSAGGQQHFTGSDDEEEYRLALEAREQFRRRKGRSTSRSGRAADPTSPQSVRSSAWAGRDKPERAESVRRSHSRRTGEGSRKKIPAPMPTPAPMQLVTDSAGDLRVIKDERQLKKEAAARELEERRKSLARRPAAPAIPHPDELSPAPARSPGHFDFPQRSPEALMALPSTVFVPYKEKDLPSRSASADPSAGRSMYANRNGPTIGLPATPKAMRLVIESDPKGKQQQGQHQHQQYQNVPVPPIPETFAQASPVMYSPGRQSPRESPKSSPRRTTHDEVEPAKKSPGVLLLPATVYTPPPPAASRPPITRSASAPPQDLAPPQGGAIGSMKGLQILKAATFEPSSMSSGRRPSHDSAMNPTTPGGGRRPSHDGSMTPGGGRRPSYDSSMPPPPPPPPAPPMLKELQHLAAPPPPPPAPLPHAGGSKPAVYGGSSAMIEIVMDDDQQGPQDSVPMISPPIPTSSRNSHQRGRSSVDNSIGARISRATDRMRSASRNRTRDNISRTKSPEVSAPYESVPMPMNFTRSPVYQQQIHQQQQQQQQQAAEQQLREAQAANDYRTGLHRSEMI